MRSKTKYLEELANQFFNKTAQLADSSEYEDDQEIGGLGQSEPKENRLDTVEDVFGPENEDDSKLSDAPTEEQVSDRIGEVKQDELMQNVMSAVEKQITKDFALKNLNPDDIYFTAFKFLTDPNSDKKILDYKVQFSSNAAQQLKAAIDENKKSQPNFIFANYLKSIIQRAAGNDVVANGMALGLML